MKWKSVRIALLNYNGEALLAECLPSVIKAAENYPGTCAVTVIDNKSADNSVAMLKKRFKKVSVWQAPENLVLVSYNGFIKTVKEEIIVILNNDMKLAPGFLAPLVPYFEKKGTFFVSPKHMSFDGKEYQGGKNKFTDRLGFLSAGPVYRGCEKDAGSSSPNLFTGNGAFDVKIFRKLGGFDPLYLPGGMEDTDLCYRAWKAGYRGYYEPKSVLYHKGSASFKKLFSNSARLTNNYRNSFLFSFKNLDLSEKIPRIILSPLTLLALLLTGRIWHILGFFAALKKLPLIKKTAHGGLSFSAIKRAVNAERSLPYSASAPSKELSIVVPVYNRKNELLLMLDSLLKQEYDRKKVEIIVSDDGSTDGTGEAVRALIKKHSELKYIRNPNSGPAAARNAGVRAASGRILGFLDSDIIAGKGLVRNVLREFKRDIKALEGATIKSGGVPETVFTHSVENLKPGRWLTCNLFILREAMHALGGFDEDFKHPVREDTAFGFAMLENGIQPAFSPKVVICHPVYKSGWKMFFKLAYYGIYEPLLCAKYPQFYFRHLKWLDSWFFPSYYAGYYALPFFLYFGLRASNTPLVWAGILLLAASYTASVYAVFRKRVFDTGSFLLAALLYVFIPYLRLFWVFAGLIRLAFPKNQV